MQGGMEAPHSKQEACRLRVRPALTLTSELAFSQWNSTTTGTSRQYTPLGPGSAPCQSGCTDKHIKFAQNVISFACQPIAECSRSNSACQAPSLQEEMRPPMDMYAAHCCSTHGNLNVQNQWTDNQKSVVKLTLLDIEPKTSPGQ
jgi:hypothetical protein